MIGLFGRRICCVAAALGMLAAVTIAHGLSGRGVFAESVRYYALPSPSETAAAWGLLNRDGAGRETEPYLSSLVEGENGAGTIESPPFVVTVDKIEFTLRGHDGRGGGRNQNYVALVDDAGGEVLRKTAAPGNDALQNRSWLVKDLHGRRVRFVAVDGIRENAFAWLGVGRIDAGDSLRVDFRDGIPPGWTIKSDGEGLRRRHVRELRNGPVPFRAAAESYSYVPSSGTYSIALGVPVRRIFLLGCTAPSERVLQNH